MTAVDPIPVAALAPARPGPDPNAHAPVTPEEAAAIARRIRVEARLPRLALVGTTLGLVCGTAAVWPFLDSGGYMASTLVGGEFGLLTFVPGWLLAGMLPLLAFYAARLHFETGHASTGEIEASLRKVRRLVVGSMFASVTAFAFCLAQPAGRGTETGPWLVLLYAGCFAGCVAVVGDVRRGLGDFDGEHQRRRRKLSRGFAVQMGGSHARQAPPADDIAFATASPGALLRTEGVSTFPAAGPAAAGAPILPTHAVPLPAMAVAVDDGQDEHAEDLRRLLTLAAIAAVALHAVRVGENLGSGLRSFGYFAMPVQFLFGSPPVPRGSAGPFEALAVIFAMLSNLLLIPCGILWVAWGLLALSYGPGLRRGVTWLTLATLVFALTASLPAWLEIHPDRVGGRRRVMATERLAHAPETVHCAFIGLLLTRPGVRRLLAPAQAMD